MAAASVYVLPSLQEAFQDQQVGLTSASFKLLPLHWDSECMRFCALKEWSLCFLQPSGFPVYKSYWPSKPDSSGGSSSRCRTPRLGRLIWGSDALLLGGNLCNCDYPPVCGLPTWQCGS